MKVYGPYRTTQGRSIINIVDGGKRRTISHARYIMQQHLGRELTRQETVDHINGDPLDDSLENLQILSLADNVRKSAKQIEYLDFMCPCCGKEFKTQARYVRHNQVKRRSSGPYCSRKCAGTFTSYRA
jgi:hypothetical protein